MRFCCALVCLLGICGPVACQRRAQVFQVKDVLATFEARVGEVPGAVKPIERLARLVKELFQIEARQKGVGGQRTVVQVAGGDQILLVQGEQGQVELVQTILDQLRSDPSPKLHLMCTLLVLPAEIATAHGLRTDEVQAADLDAITSLVKDVVKAKGTLLNLPETIATPFVPFVAELRKDGKPVPADSSTGLRVRGEAVALGADEAVFALQLVQGRLPEDRTVVPKTPLLDQAFRLRVGAGVTMMAKDDKTATVLWLRFTSAAIEPPKGDKRIPREGVRIAGQLRERAALLPR